MITSKKPFYFTQLTNSLSAGVQPPYAKEYYRKTMTEEELIEAIRCHPDPLSLLGKTKILCPWHSAWINDSAIRHDLCWNTICEIPNDTPEARIEADATLTLQGYILL